MSLAREWQIRDRLNAAIDRAGLDKDRETVARYTVRLLVPEVLKLLREEVLEVKSRQRKGEE